MDELKKEERRLLKMAEEKREAYASSPEAAIDTLGSFRREMREAYEQTLASVYTITKKVNQKGEVITSVYSGGISSDPDAVLVYTNVKSRRERSDKIQRAFYREALQIPALGPQTRAQANKVIEVLKQRVQRELRRAVGERGARE